MLILIARVLHSTGMETLTFHTPRLGLTDAELMEGARRSTMDELAAETLAADKVLVF